MQDQHLPRRAFSLEEVASTLGLSYTHVRREVINKRLRAIKSGGIWRVPVSALDDYLEGTPKPAKVEGA